MSRHRSGFAAGDLRPLFVAPVFLAPLFVAPVFLGSAGCFPDSVAPGYYGAEDAGSDGAASSGSAAPASTDTSAPAGDDGTSPAATADAAPGAPGAEGGAPAGPCDLTGTWLATDREVATGDGATEAAHAYWYLEIAQSGTAVTVTKGLFCGEAVSALSLVGATVTYAKTWPAMQAKVTMAGRKATSKPSGSECAISFDEFYIVEGATEAYYLDPSQAMPTLSQQASGSTPGWEDWDNDGNPGFTMNVTGLTTGSLYMAVRKHNQWSGTIAAGASSFQLADNWNDEEDVLGFAPASNMVLTLAASGAKDNDTSLQFVDFARLTAAQATGDDNTLCATMRQLAPTLTMAAAN